jgi:hypothetical protein
MAIEDEVGAEGEGEGVVVDVDVVAGDVDLLLKSRLAGSLAMGYLL